MTEKLQAILDVEGLSALLSNFNEQGVTDSILGDLTDSDLKELGIGKLGERKRLLAAFVSATTVSSPPPTIQVSCKTPHSAQEDFTYEAVNGQIIITGFRGSGHAVIPEQFDELPLPVRAIAVKAFGGNNSLTAVTIPSSITCIENFTFVDCSNLTSVTIGSGVRSVEASAFERCTQLMGIFVNEDNAAYMSLDGVLFDKRDRKLVVFPKAKAGDYKISDIVESIGCQSFSRCSTLINIIIPDSVKTIESHAFSDCSNITTVSFGNGVSVIGDAAFQNCAELKHVVLPNSVTSIGEYAFSGCAKLSSFAVPDSVAQLPSFMLKGCTGLTDLHIGCCIQSIGSGAFKGCTNLTNVTIPDGLKTVADSAFDDCTSLTSVLVPSDLQIVKNPLAETNWRPRLERRQRSKKPSLLSRLTKG
jgi:hypothetical protein